MTNLTPDERYIYEERLGILCGASKPTDEQIRMAMADVARFRKMNSNETPELFDDEIH